MGRPPRECEPPARLRQRGEVTANPGERARPDLGGTSIRMPRRQGICVFDADRQGGKLWTRPVERFGKRDDPILREADLPKTGLHSGTSAFHPTGGEMTISRTGAFSILESPRLGPTESDPEDASLNDRIGFFIEPDHLPASSSIPGKPFYTIQDFLKRPGSALGRDFPIGPPASHASGRVVVVGKPTPATHRRAGGGRAGRFFRSPGPISADPRFNLKARVRHPREPGLRRSVDDQPRLHRRADAEGLTRAIDGAATSRRVPSATGHGRGATTRRPRGFRRRNRGNSRSSPDSGSSS